MTLTRKQEQDQWNASLNAINVKLEDLSKTNTKMSTDVEELKNVIIKNLPGGNFYGISIIRNKNTDNKRANKNSRSESSIT